MIIVHDEGGLYMDLDFYIAKWDKKLNYYFDFHGFRDKEFDVHVLSTWGYGAIPRHPIIVKHIEVFLHNYHLPMSLKPFNLNPCFWKISGSVLFATGPFFFAMIFSKAVNQEGMQDVLLENPKYHSFILLNTN